MVKRKQRGQQPEHPIRVGVGGWSFAPWKQTFYPPGLPARLQLEYMSRKMTAIEVNATFYALFKPETFTKWAAAAPDGFMFSLKAHRFSTVRKNAADMKKSIDLFLGQGLTRLRDKLGPINWQFPAARNFDPDYFNAFLSLLPRERDRVPLRHALEVRGSGFDAAEFGDLLRKYRATVVWVDDAAFPKLRHEASDFAVARIKQSSGEQPAGYSQAAITSYAKLVRSWAKSQDVFAFFIAGAKGRNPAAAMALQQVLGVTPQTSAAADNLVSKRPAH